MAKRKYYSNYNSKNRYYAKPKKKSKYTNVEKTAFMFGCVKRGLKNPESRIYESYQKGLELEATKKKSLF